MNVRRLLCVALAVGTLATVATAAPAQISSDLPGVPRASVPFHGARQSRTAFLFSYYSMRSGDAASTGDTLAFGGQVSLGQSYRVGTRWEAGYDFTLGEAFHVRPPAPQAGVVSGGEPINHTRAFALYAIRLGAKFRPVHVLSPEGYGYEASVAASYQPSLDPLFGITVDGDSTRTGGLVGKDDDDRFGSGAVHSAYEVAGIGSYRARRFSVDGALVYESVETRGGDSALSPLESYSGLSPRLGGVFRLTRGIGVGASWWGNGSPPWRDRVRLQLPEGESQSFAPFLSFGSKPESGMDVMLISPTGDYGRSVQLYIRGRSTR